MAFFRLILYFFRAIFFQGTLVYSKQWSCGEQNQARECSS